MKTHINISVRVTNKLHRRYGVFAKIHYPNATSEVYSLIAILKWYCSETKYIQHEFMDKNSHFKHLRSKKKDEILHCLYNL